MRPLKTPDSQLKIEGNKSSAYQVPSLTKGYQINSFVTHLNRTQNGYLSFPKNRDGTTQSGVKIQDKLLAENKSKTNTDRKDFFEMVRDATILVPKDASPTKMSEEFVKLALESQKKKISYKYRKRLEKSKPKNNKLSKENRKAKGKRDHKNKRKILTKTEVSELVSLLLRYSNQKGRERRNEYKIEVNKCISKNGIASESLLHQQLEVKLFKFISRYDQLGAYFQEAQIKNCTKTLQLAKNHLTQPGYRPPALEEINNQFRRHNHSNFKKIHGQLLIGRRNEKITYTEMSKTDLIKLIKLDKQKSSNFQEYLKYSPPDVLQTLEETLQDDIYSLCYHKYGCYVVQTLIQRSQQLCERFGDTCIENFEFMIQNEYSCRILQRMVIAGNKKVIDFAISQMEGLFEIFLDSLSSALFCIRLFAVANEEQKEFIIDKLKCGSRQLLKKRHFLRIFYFVVKESSRSFIQNAYSHLKPFTFEFLNHKFGHQILLILIRQELREPVDQIQTLCLRHSKKLLFQKYGRLVIFELVKSKSKKKGQFCKNLMDRLDIWRLENLQRILSQKESSVVFQACLFSINHKDFKRVYSQTMEALLGNFASLSRKDLCKSKIFLQIKVSLKLMVFRFRCFNEAISVLGEVKIKRI